MFRYVNRASSGLCFAALISVITFQMSLSTAQTGGDSSNSRLQIRQKRGLIKMSDLLMQLDRKRISKRTTQGQPIDFSKGPSSSLQESIASEAGSSKRTLTDAEFASTSGRDSLITKTRNTARHQTSKKRRAKKLFVENNKKDKKNSYNSNNRKSVSKKKRLNASRLRIGEKSRFVKNVLKSNKYRTKNKRKSLRFKSAALSVPKRKNSKFRRIRDKLISSGFGTMLVPSVGPSSWKYHVVRIPLFSIVSPYSETIPDYAANRRSNIYYRDVSYDPENYEDGRYDQRKDVIPKPGFVTIAEQGTKKDSFLPAKGFRQTAYSPIVSAVQNLDQSEAKLFDSILSTSHESNRLTDNIGTELASFAGTPGDLEVYTPTDTPGQLYFERDYGNGSPAGNTQYFETTSKPSKAPTSLVDNEEKLLSMVEKVIEKQEMKKKGKSESESKQPQSTVAIGDTSEVFNTGRSQEDKMAKEQPGKLQDFLNRQPNLAKKVKSAKDMKHGSQETKKVTKVKPRVKEQGKGKTVIAVGVSKSQGKQSKQVKQRPVEKVRPSGAGKFVIVENVSPANDKLLMESLKHEEKEGRKNGNASNNREKLVEAGPQVTAKGSRKTLDGGLRKGAANHLPHVIKEIVDENEAEGSQSTVPDGSSERASGYEVASSLAGESKGGRFKIDREKMKAVSERNPGDWTIGTVTSQKLMQRPVSGDRRDDGKPDAKEAGAEEKESPDEKDSSSSSTGKPDEEPVEKPEEKPDLKPDTSAAKVVESGKNQTGTVPVEEVKKPKAAPLSPGKPTNQHAGEDFADWFNGESEGQKLAPDLTPPEVDSVQPPGLTNQTIGWRIRDYFLDDQNASNWDQIRTAWTNKSGTPFVFNNRIQVNPSGGKSVTMPPIQFGTGVTMPTLPTMAAPTGIPMQGFPSNDEDDDEDDDDIQQQVKMRQQQQNPLMQMPQNPATTPSYGLQYPWQWHNRRPNEGRYHGTKLHFHGKPTVHALVVTTRRPTTSAQQLIVTRPTTVIPKQENVNDASNASDAVSTLNQQQGTPPQEQVTEKAKEDDQPNENQVAQEVKGQDEGKGQNDYAKETEQGKAEEEVKADEGQGEGQKGDKMVQTDEKVLEGQSNRNVSNSWRGEENGTVYNEDNGSNKLVQEGRWSESSRLDGVLNESMTHSNSTVRQLDKGQRPYSEGSGKQIANVTSFTKPPEGLPMLSEPTTKSAQNFLPGLRPPSVANKEAGYDNRYSVFPPWSGGYVESLRKTYPKSGNNVETSETTVNSPESSNVDELNKILVEESTQKVPSDEAAKQVESLSGGEAAREASQDSFAFESRLLQKEETEKADSRARVSDTPISMQAESINLIRQRASASQKAAQRQQVSNGTSIAFTGQAVGAQQSRAPNMGYQTEKIEIKEQKSPFMITQGVSSQGNNVSRYEKQPTTAVSGGGQGWSQGNKLRPGPTSIPRATATKPKTAPLVTEEIHHPTPRPLFPINIVPKSPLKATINANKGASEEYAAKNASNTQQASPNVSFSQQYEIPVYPITVARPETKTATTTPSAIGYKTTDWTKAFTTTERSGNYPVELQAKQRSEGSAVVSQPQGPTQYNNNNNNNNTTIAVVEGKYQTDVATMRTTPGTAQGLNIMGPSAATAYTYASGIPSYAPQPAVAQVNSYAPSGNPLGWNAPDTQSASGKPVDSLSDAYLSKFGDQLNMEDLYWTDSTEEKEEICKQEKGTNEVVHILCFGDSLTRGYYNKGKSHHPYTNKLQYLLNKLDTKKCYIVENEGKDGELAYEEMPKRLETVLKSEGTNYEWTVILGGTNDIYNKKKSKRVTEQAITQNIISMHEIARRHNSRSVAVTIPEVYCETQDTCQDAKQLREKVNGNIRDYAYQNSDRVVLVDLADMLQRSNVGRDMIGQFFEGGLHLKPRGYERMAIIIFEGLKRALS